MGRHSLSHFLVATILIAGAAFASGQSNLDSDDQFSAGGFGDIGRISAATAQQQQAQQQPQFTITSAPRTSVAVSTSRSAHVSRTPQASVSSVAVAAVPPVRTTPLALPSFLSQGSAQAQAPVYVSQPAFASFQSSSAAAAAATPHQAPVSPQVSSQSVGHSALFGSQAQATVSQTQPIVSAASQPDQIMAPSYESVLQNGCPSLGVFSYEHSEFCDRYFLCTNGTFTQETCPNGLSYGTQGAVYQHCAYRWNIDCGKKKAPGPISSPGCPWQFGVFPIDANTRCSIDYYECEWGVPEVKRCQPEGLFYDDRIKGCQWADQLGCKSEGLLNFKCPREDEENPYWPYPRYYHSQLDVIVCVNEQPRLVHCTEEQHVDPQSLACIDNEKKRKLKKF